MNGSIRLVAASAAVASLFLGSMLELGADQRSVRAGRRGVAVKGEEGYAAVGRRGAVVSGEEGYAAVSRRGAVVKGEEAAAAAVRPGPYRPGGVVVAGEEGVVAARGPGYYRPGVVVAGHYEDHEGWKTAAAVAGGVAAGIAIGTMLSKPPAQSTTVVVSGSTYYYHDNVFYTRVITSGNVAYQVVAPPAGAIIATLPGGCSTVRVNNVAYSQCGPTYYQRVSNGYQVVIIN